MRKWLCVTLLIALTLPLTGCMMSRQLENQAHAVSLAVDRTETGEMELSVLVPTIASNASQGAEAGGSSDYAISSATAATFTEALDLLRATVSRRLNLTQLKAIIFSQEIASEPAFRGLVSDMVLTQKLYGAAYCIVSLGEAKTLLTNQHPAIGTSLSTTIVAALEHYQEHGYIPDSRLDSVYYATRSIYSDPVAILAATNDGVHYRAMPAGAPGEALPGTLPRAGINKNEYMGCALLHGGRMVGVLNGIEMQWLNVMLGQSANVRMIFGDKPVQIEPNGGRSIRVDCQSEPARISVSLRLAATPLNDMPPLAEIGAQIEAEISALIAHCQSLGCEPFGFAEIAARQFFTINDWIAYDWRARFESAQVEVSVAVDKPSL